MATATHISAQLAADLADCLRRLRQARSTGDEREEYILNLRLDWLLDKVGRR